jgi:hypothetical protein
MHGYSLADPASAHLFACHVTQASSLRALLGTEAYGSLVAAYAAEVTPTS